MNLSRSEARFFRILPPSWGAEAAFLAAEYPRPRKNPEKTAAARAKVQNTL